METELVVLLDGNFFCLPDTEGNVHLIRVSAMEGVLLEGDGFCVKGTNVLGYYRRAKPVTMDTKKFNEYLAKEAAERGEGESWKDS